MTGKLEFFYDYVSVYSYLANHEVARLDAEVEYRPMFLGAVMKATGNRPPAALPARAAWLETDVGRWAQRYGIPFRLNSVFPQNTLTALRVALVARHRGRFDDIHQRLFDAMFVDDRDLSDRATLSSLLEEAGFDAEDCLAAAESEEIKAELRQNTDEAIARGAFGAPTMFVGEEMFFGNDRFDFVRAALAGKAGDGG